MKQTAIAFGNNPQRRPIAPGSGNRIARLFVLLLLGVFAGMGLRAQNTNSGDIRGTVTDANGAVVPGVKVSVEDVDKNVTRTYVTNGAGLYETGSIVPDHYKLTFSKEGFETYVRGPITVLVGDSAVNVQLKVGATVQQVVVSDDIPLLQSESGDQSTTLAGKTLAQLPQIGANWTNFIVLLPGASGIPFAKKSISPVNSGQHTAINGNLAYSNILNDGATATLPGSENADVSIFPTIAEVKVSDSSFSAQYGIGGIIYNQISKGGTSQFHGQAYEYFQNDALNAAPYSFGATGKVPILRYNNFGFNVGGPVLKRKMFFFFDFDKTLNHGGAANGFISVPTAAMLAGDFTGMPTIYDPTTQTVDSKGVVHRQSFASEYNNGNKIPASMIDPVAKIIGTYFPAPNLTGTIVNGLPTNNYFYNVPSTSSTTAFFGRLDYDVNPKHRLTISETEGDSPQLNLNQGICPINCQRQDGSHNNAQISDVWTLGQNKINEARFGFTQEFYFVTPYSLNQGFPNTLDWKFSKANIFPTVAITDEYTLQPAVNEAQKQFVYDPSDVFTWIHGRHVLHFGGEFLDEQINSTGGSGNINGGSMYYTGAYTASTQGTGNTTGVGLADFLLGWTQKWSAQVTPEFGGRLKSAQFFAQDDIKLRPTLTVNVGLRYQGMTGWSEVHGNEMVFDPTILNTASASNGAIWYGSTAANGRTSLQAPMWDTFLPRIGASYLLTPTTTIRGGFGLYAYILSTDTYGTGLGAAFGSKGSYTDTTNGVLPVVLLSSDGSTNYQGAGGSSIDSLYIAATTDPTAFNGQAVSYNQYHTPVPKIYQWDMDIQRQLSQNFMAEIAYVGSHGFNLSFPVDINQVPASKLASNDASGSTNARPYPQYQGIGGSTNNAISNYNSLQASLQKRLSYGLEFNFNYTWSHFLDEQDSAGWGGKSGNTPYQSSYSPDANYGPSNFDIRQMFKGTVTYALPFGRGMKFLNNSTLLDEVIGGWHAATTILVQGGNPFTPTMKSNTSYSQAGNLYPNVVGNPLSGPHHTIQEWFNVAAYAAPAPATFGNSSRNPLYGPGLTNVNLSVGKTFSIWERAKMEIRGDATNVFNHPSFNLPDNTIGQGHTAQITNVTVGGRAMQLYAQVYF
jgi:hypothetical protein